jgi:hypothetical protein
MTVLDAAAERQKLRREPGRLDTIFFLISASGSYFPARRVRAPRAHPIAAVITPATAHHLATCIRR